MPTRYTIITLAVLIIAGGVVYAKPFSNRVHAPLVIQNDEIKKVKDKEKEPKLLIMNVGDIMFDRFVRQWMAAGIKPLQHVGDIKQEIEEKFGEKVDVSIANLEGPITNSSTCQQKPFSFKFASTTGKMLKDTGFDIMNLANNHSNDCYAQGIIDTRRNLDHAGIKWMGGGSSIENSSVAIKSDSFDIVFVGIDETIEPIELELFYPYIMKLALEHEAVIVNIHWGKEYMKIESPRQKSIAHKLIDSGALAVVGHHPHVTQPMEFYQNGVIFYSLGNFIFDQTGVEETKGGVAAVLLKKKDSKVVVERAEMIPVKIVRSVPCGVSCTNDKNRATTSLAN